MPLDEEASIGSDVDSDLCKYCEEIPVEVKLESFNAFVRSDSFGDFEVCPVFILRSSKGGSKGESVSFSQSDPSESSLMTMSSVSGSVSFLKVGVFAGHFFDLTRDLEIRMLIENEKVQGRRKQGLALNSCKTRNQVPYVAYQVC